MLKKIGIECHNLEGSRFGVGQTLIQLLEALSQTPGIEEKFEFYLYFKKEIPSDEILKSPVFRKKILRAPYFPPSFTLFYNLLIPICYFIDSLNGFFFPSYMLPAFFVGKSADRDWYNNNLSFLPASLGNRTEFTPKSLRISRWDSNHPIFSVFRDEGVANTLRTPEFYSAFSITPKSGTNVISSFDKNIPAILESKSSNLVPPSNGRKEEKIGKVIVFNFSPDPQVSDVALRPMFLPLMQQTVLCLFSSGRDNEKNLLVGDIYSQNVYDKIDSAPMITDPEGKGALATLTESNQAGIRKIGFDSTQHAGIYKIEFKSGGIAQRDYLAVNLNTTGESDLKSAKEDDIITKLGSQARFVSLNESFEKTIESKTKSSDISSRLLILAVLLMLLEIPLANRYKIKESQDVA